MDKDLDLTKLVGRNFASPGMTWGRNDCVRWASNVSLGITGHDLLDDESWSDEAEGRARIAEDGNLYKALLRKFLKKGMQKADPETAGKGALGIYIDQDRNAYLAVKIAKGFFACRRQYGIDLIPEQQIRQCRVWATI